MWLYSAVWCGVCVCMCVRMCIVQYGVVYVCVCECAHVCSYVGWAQLHVEMCSSMAVQLVFSDTVCD